jgi:prepilin-type N-terminal cleavage/methylation domain-containing protein
MSKKNGFTLIELLVVIFIIGVLLAFSVPNFAAFQEKARVSALKMNMHNVSVVIEEYYSEKGEYAIDFYEDGYGSFFPGGDPYSVPQLMGTLPTNPWSGEVMSEENFNPDWYWLPEDVSNTEEGGPNDDDGYEPGEMRYSMYIPEGSPRIKLWGLIGFGIMGQSIRQFNATGDELIIFVLHN